MTTTTTRVAPVVRRARRYLTAPVVSVLAAISGMTFLFLALYLAAGGPVGVTVVLIVAGATVVASMVVGALVFADSVDGER